MWALSTPGGEAEGSFLRALQTEYYVEKEEHSDLLSFYPDVRQSVQRTAEFAYLDPVSTFGGFRICMRTTCRFRRLFYHTQHQYAYVSPLPACTVPESWWSHCARIRSTHRTGLGGWRGGVYRK